MDLTVTAGHDTLVRQTNLTLQGFQHLIDQIDAQTQLDKIYVDNLPPKPPKATTTSSNQSQVKKLESGRVELGHDDARTFGGSGYVHSEIEDCSETEDDRSTNDNRELQWSDDYWFLNS